MIHNKPSIKVVHPKIGFITIYVLEYTNLITLITV